MSAILATEIVQSAFGKARNAVLNSSERIIETVFVGIPLLDLTVDECKALVVTINASLSKSDMRSWSTDSSKGYLYRGKSMLICSHFTDQPAHKTHIMIDRSLFK